jgi:hypothetical protein
MLFLGIRVGLRILEKSNERYCQSFWHYCFGIKADFLLQGNKYIYIAEFFQ